MCIEDGYYKILGRTSVDIIKSGGFKISALDIESKLLTHPDILECVILGAPDPSKCIFLEVLWFYLSTCPFFSIDLLSLRLVLKL